MSRTIRRKKGDQYFRANSTQRRETNNDPFYMQSPIQKKWIGEYVERKGFRWNRVNGKFENYTYIDQVGHWVEWYEPKPRDLDEVREWDKDTERKATRDGWGHYWKKSLKEAAEYVRRSDNREELARLKKIENYEEMDYVPTLRESNPWYFD